MYPGFPDAAGAGQILKSRSRPLPTHPGMKYFRKEILAVDLALGCVGRGDRGSLQPDGALYNQTVYFTTKGYFTTKKL